MLNGARKRGRFREPRPGATGCETLERAVGPGATGCETLERAVATGCNTDSSLSAFGEVEVALESDAAQGRRGRWNRRIASWDRRLSPRNRRRSRALAIGAITRSMSRVWDTAWARMTQYTAITVRYKRAELHTCCKVLPGRTEPTRNPEPRRDWEHFRTNCSRDKPRERRREYSRAWADGAILTKLSVESGSGGHDVWIQVRFTHCRYVA